MKRWSIFSLGLISLLVSTAWVAKDDPFASLLKKLEEFTKNYPSEKIHIHLDKPYYSTSDDIWFKAYVVDSRTAEPTTISNVLYVELINDQDSVERQLKLAMQGGIAWADFKLTSDMNEGKYRIRAYTQWMRNAGAQFFFDKAIRIGNLNTKNTKVASKPEKQVDVQFFPEGGSLVDGLPSKIAVKSINPNGLSENISGIIVDNEGTEILNFETTYLGMGSFSLTPIPGKTYTAKVKLANGTTNNISFPKSLPNGFVLNINTLDTSKIGVKVFISEELRNTGNLSLLAHQNGNAIFTAQVPTTKQIASVNIATKEFLSGIITLTLFSAENKPLAERITFINNGIDKIELQAQKLKKSYTKRENVNFDIFAAHLNKSTQGSFSVSITNSSIINPDLGNETHILTSLLLGSELIGNIENPNDYFNKNDVITRTRLDHLLLTQGWRKIDWKTVSNNQIPVNRYAAEKGLIISGVVRQGGKPVANEKIALLSTVGGLVSIDTLTNADGKFSFDKLQFGEEVPFVIQAKNKTSKKPFDIVLDVIPQQPTKGTAQMGRITIAEKDTIKTYSMSQQNIDKTSQPEKNNSLATDSVNTNLPLIAKTEVAKPTPSQTLPLKKNTLKEVEIKGEKKNLAPNSLNFNGPGVADAIFTDDDLKSVTDLKTHIYGRVPGISLVKNNLYLSRTGIESPGVPKLTIDPMRIYLDGVYIETLKLEDVPIPDIESLEILKSPANTAIYGLSNGIILITTKGGSSKPKKLNTVEITASTKAPNSTNLNGPGSADAVFDAKDLKSATSLTQFLNGRVSGFTVTNGIPILTRNGDTMTVYVDGVAYIDGQGGVENPGEKPSLEGLEIANIESIEILKSAAYTAVYGHSGSNGVVLITTKTGQANTVKTVKSPGILTITAKGYYPIRQFYSPNYDTHANTNPDLRTTIYWNPHLVTDQKGKATINFFNADLPGQYRILIEGIDAYGNLARKTFMYDVK